VLWDLNLVVEFPPGALILLPSATLAHSNIPVAPGEKRASFTQFSAGGIFRYVDNGFRTEEQLEEDNREEYERLMDLKASRWEEELNLLSKMDELLAT
jgi:predicted 2-oxoglutarate/Fe(II)-dependent dioxygenase YbiX